MSIEKTFFSYFREITPNVNILFREVTPEFEWSLFPSVHSESWRTNRLCPLPPRWSSTSGLDASALTGSTWVSFAGGLATSTAIGVPKGRNSFFLRYFAFLKFNFFVVARNYNLRKPRSELLCGFQREKGKNVLKVILNLVWRGTFETIEVHCAFGGKNDFILCVCVALTNFLFF